MDPSIPKEVIEKPSIGSINRGDSSLIPTSSGNNYNVGQIQNAYDVVESLDEDLPSTLHTKVKNENDLLFVE